jgi:integrase
MVKDTNEEKTFQMNKGIWEKYYHNLLNAGVTKTRIDKLFLMFKTAARGLNKRYDEASRDDIEAFITRLHTNKFKKKNGEEFSGSTKSDIKKFLKQFYKWLKGNNEIYPSEVAFIHTKIAKDERPEERPVLSILEVRKLAAAFDKPELQLMTLLLFDSGFRIQEMLSMRKKDLTYEQYEDTKKCFWLSCNESKTMTRKIPVPLFTEDILTFYNSNWFIQKKDDSPLFDVSYPYYSTAIKINGEKLFKKSISAHALRHSSATYYAKELNGNVMAICQRYGWSFSSKEVALYVRRSGAYQKDTAKVIVSNELVKVREDYEKLKAETEELRKQLQDLPKLLIQAVRENPKALREALRIQERSK